jgi:GNAT superfamily N-acetyltransferase
MTHGANDDSPKLRVAGAADGPEVARVFGAAWARMDFVPKLHTPEEDRAFFTKQLEQATGFVAERAGAIVGFAIHDAQRLRHLYVHPSWQRGGLGAALLSAVKAALPAGFDLWTFVPNAGARRFYERHGFRAVEQTDGSGNEEGVADVRYLWRPSGD